MRYAILLGLAGLSLVSVPAGAQSRTASGRGKGALALPKAATIALYHANFKQSSRTVTLVFVGKNPAVPYPIEGRITGSTSSSNLQIQITGGLRDSEIRGSGRVTLAGSNLQRVTVSGTVKGGSFNLKFLGDGTGEDEDLATGGITGAEPINTSTLGSGTYEFSGRRTTLNEARIRLHDDGRAELRFDGDRDADARGTWRRGYDGRADIDITEWNGRRTSGTAVMSYRGGQIERVRVNVPSQNARVDFSPGGTGGDNWSGNNTARPTTTSFVGTGAFRERGRTYQLDEVSIRLRDNGEAELRFNGDRQTRGRGRWTAAGSYARLTIEEWDGRRTKGSGTVAFANNQPNQVNVSIDGGRSITFRSTPQIQPR